MECLENKGNELIDIKVLAYKRREQYRHRES